jgi:hypothetical protein
MPTSTALCARETTSKTALLLIEKIYERKTTRRQKIIGSIK